MNSIIAFIFFCFIIILFSIIMTQLSKYVDLYIKWYIKNKENRDNE